MLAEDNSCGGHNTLKWGMESGTLGSVDLVQVLEREVVLKLRSAVLMAAKYG
jgi:hypothetical protein